MRTIGFFGGSFDPIHYGHISLALQLMESQALDEVLFCPAFCSPSKTASPPIAPPEHRLAMLRLGLEGVPRVRITTIELDRGGPSFTIDTLRILKTESSKLRLLLSEEAASRFDLWKEAAELIRLAPPLIGARHGASPIRGPLGDALKRGFTPTKLMEISSTEIRDRLKKGLYCGHLVPAKTLDYIHSNRLYS
jgi:nicotinate-nucleotide adenylyltransferase